MQEEIESLAAQATQDIEAAPDVKALEDLKVLYLGRKSRLRDIMGQIGGLGPAEKPVVGQAAGKARKGIEAALERRQAQLQEEAEAGEAFDMTLPGRRRRVGAPHPLNRIADELIDVFAGMGFTLEDGPEIEDEYHNFDALNTPANHPARDLHDTFYLQGGGLLRTHTSTVQVRVMEKTPPPVRIMSVGRCYRNENVDATHHYAFHQIEGLYVDKGVTLADLKGTLAEMGRRLLGADTKVRFRPHFFPFTEPSVEYDFSSSIKESGWIEVGGAGMVDPAVFEAVGYDPEVYTGFAFGLGIDRIAMIRHGIDDIRLFLENDLRFIRQF